MAQSYVRMAAMLRYENIAALKHHQERDRELNERIAAAGPPEAARLQAQREDLRRAGLWRPTIPGPREARAIIRYAGSLDRTIRRAASELKDLRKMRIGGASPTSKAQKRCEASPNSVLRLGEGPRMPPPLDTKVQKQTHYSASPNNGPEARRRASAQRFDGPEAAEGPRTPQVGDLKTQKQSHFAGSPNSIMRTGEGPQVSLTSMQENAKTNPLSSMFAGNRHQRRRARALATRRR